MRPNLARRAPRHALAVVSALAVLLVLGAGPAARGGTRATVRARRQVVDPFGTASMHAFLAGRTGIVTAAVYDVSNKQTYTLHPGVAQQTASIVKVDILATLLDQAQGEHRQLTGTEMDTASDMIEDSDNDDATALWDEVGGARAVASFDKRIGLDDTVPNTAGYWGETMTTALDQITLLKHLAFANDVLDNASRSYELDLMEHVVGYEDWGVSGGVEHGVTVALKNGWVPVTSYTDWQVNSIGVIEGDGIDYLIAVMTTHDPSEDYGIATIDGVSSRVFEGFEDND